MEWTDLIISQLGQPDEPFGWGHVAVIAVVFGLFAVELLLGHGLSKLALRVWRNLTRPDNE